MSRRHQEKLLRGACGRYIFEGQVCSGIHEFQSPVGPGRNDFKQLQGPWEKGIFKEQPALGSMNLNGQ